MTGHAEEASDLTQETFAKLRLSLPGYRGEGSFKGWLYRIAFREYLRWIRDRDPHTVELDDTHCAPAHSVEDALTLNYAIAGLPDEFRSAFWLREVERLSVRDVAEALGIPEGTVKSRCHEARSRLQLKLGATWEFPSEKMEADHVV